jgi:SWI/SNF-related matrix-associated actin-dependent regulator 1 of chromatin subfamily A
MGVGKTVQALAAAYIYKNDWPLLILTPSSLKFVWRDEIRKWLPMIPKGQIEVVQSSKNAFSTQSQIFIMSYDLAKNVKGVLETKTFSIAIADEAHYLKSKDTKRSKILNPILIACKRVILVSGTPMLSRPQEVFNIVHILRPDLFTRFTEFGRRYCDPKPGVYGVDWSGCDHPDELHLILSTTMMIRRLKSEVLAELPQKQRQRINVVPDKKLTQEILNVISNIDSNTIESTISKDTSLYNTDQENLTSKDTLRTNIFNAYRLTGMAKIKGTINFITTLIENEIKFILFAQHLDVLNELEVHLTELKQKFIRIDGSVPIKKRHLLVSQFQESHNYKAALLSITASSQGITLTAAYTIVFAEFAWTPALMYQAEDRVHRISQKHSVNIYYLYAEDTLDPILYKIIKSKNEVVGKTLDGVHADYKLVNGIVPNNGVDVKCGIETPKVTNKNLLSYFQFVDKNKMKGATIQKVHASNEEQKVTNVSQELVITDNDLEELLNEGSNDWYAALDITDQEKLIDDLDEDKAEGKRKRNKVNDNIN